MKKLALVFALSWIFLPGRYTNTAPVRPRVQALPTPVTHGYNRSWTYLRGADGSVDVYYRGSRW